MKRQRKGFTLVELAIVIAILGILAVVAVPKYQGMVAEARSAQAKAQLGTMRSAIAISYAKNKGTFPTLDDVQNGTIFADGQTPTVEITDASGTVISSKTVVAPTTAGTLTPTTSEGGWMYDAVGGSGGTGAGRVIINSSSKDPATNQAWSSY
ncbi:MAG: type IV pilin protein [Candidatus Cryosericum sp.]